MKIPKLKEPILKDLLGTLTPEEEQIIQDELQYLYLLKRFREARLELGLTQAVLAKKANINRTTLSMIESGYRNATLDTLSQLARAMNLQLDIELIPLED